MLSVAPTSAKKFWHESESIHTARDGAWEWSLSMLYFYLEISAPKLFSRIRLFSKLVFCVFNTIEMKLFGWEWKLSISGIADIFFHLYSAWRNGKMHLPLQFICCQLDCGDLKLSLVFGILLPLPISVCYQLGRLPRVLTWGTFIPEVSELINSHVSGNRAE